MKITYEGKTYYLSGTDLFIRRLADNLSPALFVRIGTENMNEVGFINWRRSWTSYSIERNNLYINYEEMSWEECSEEVKQKVRRLFFGKKDMYNKLYGWKKHD